MGAVGYDGVQGHTLELGLNGVFFLLTQAQLLLKSVRRTDDCARRIQSTQQQSAGVLVNNQSTPQDTGGLLGGSRAKGIRPPKPAFDERGVCAAENAQRHFTTNRKCDDLLGVAAIHYVDDNKRIEREWKGSASNRNTHLEG